MTTPDIHIQNRRALIPLRRAMRDFDLGAVRESLSKLLKPGAAVRLCHPFEDLDGAEGWLRGAFVPLHTAIPDLERRDLIVMAGADQNGAEWVGTGGYYTGLYLRPLLDIPPTGHQVSLRFHEFYRFEDGRVAEMQAIWDIPELMMQAGAWPMAPSLGREWHVPGPVAQDGVSDRPRDPDVTEASRRRVADMLVGLGRHAVGGPKAMRLQDHWHPRMNWYGPSGIGTCRGIGGFRNWHQIPFLNALPDRIGDPEHGHLFADGPYVGFTGWPGMSATVTGDGWMGISPSGRSITLRSLDFWRCEEGLIRENWVLVDLLNVFDQLGVDVLGRMREFNKARGLHRIELPAADWVE